MYQYIAIFVIEWDVVFSDLWSSSKWNKSMGKIMDFLLFLKASYTDKWFSSDWSFLFVMHGSERNFPPPWWNDEFFKCSKQSPANISIKESSDPVPVESIRHMQILVSYLNTMLYTINNSPHFFIGDHSIYLSF